MPLVIILLGAIALFLYLAMNARRNKEDRKLFYLFSAIVVWLTVVFGFLLVTAVLDL
jgi:heme/copper-type cytochrome/quinol oxidase subunit 4